MTETTTPKSDLNPMKLCDSCAGVQRNWRKAKGHPELMQGTNRSETHKHGQVTITRYRCERCGTSWEYENNQVNRHAGWSVVGG
jgi:transposase-like protein